MQEHERGETGEALRDRERRPCWRCQTEIELAKAAGYQRGFQEGLAMLTKTIADAESLRPRIMIFDGADKQQAMQGLADALQSMRLNMENDRFVDVTKREMYLSVIDAAVESAKPFLK